MHNIIRPFKNEPDSTDEQNLLCIHQEEGNVAFV